MSLEDFAEITQRVIRKNGFEQFSPTLCLPEQKHISVLEGILEEEQPKIRSISLSWARERAKGEEFLLALRENERSFRIIRSCKDEISEKVFPVRTSSDRPFWRRS
jgi:hypothetical protein